MAYVPGFKTDVFLSYAQADGQEWIRALQESVSQELVARLGEAEIWQDVKNIRFGQNWRDELDAAVKSAACLLAVVSPNYRRSQYCDLERNSFIEHCEKTEGLKAGRYYRFLKLVKTPWPRNAHEQFCADYQHINFFESRATDDPIPDSSEFAPHSEAFRRRVIQATHAIASLLEQMRRSRESIFVAGVTPDCVELREQLVAELRALGYDARPDGNPDKRFSDVYLKDELANALLSIHVLGGAYEPFGEKQIELALELEKPLLFWCTRGTETATSQQQQVIERVRMQGHEWLPKSSAQSVARVVSQKLKPRPCGSTAFDSTEGAVARIYLLCDPTTPVDAGFAADVQRQITELEHMDVVLPAPSQTDDAHERLLREADGLLLYRNAAPAQWLYRTAEHLIHAERLSRRAAPHESKGFLLADPSVLGEPPVPVYRPSTPFTLNDIEEFLAKLRREGDRAA